MKIIIAVVLLTFISSIVWYFMDENNYDKEYKFLLDEETFLLKSIQELPRLEKSKLPFDVKSRHRDFVFWWIMIHNDYVEDIQKDNKHWFKCIFVPNEVDSLKILDL